MRSKSAELMQQIRNYVEEYFFESEQYPSTTEIAKAVGIARGTAYKYLVEMDQRGMISYDGKSIITEKTRLLSPGNDAGIYSGSTPCGPLEEIEAAVESYVKLPVSIFGEGDLFIIRTTGDSMIDAGIDSGDLVVVRKDQSPKLGDIVVALSDNANTLKRLDYDDNRRQYVLRPENSNYDPIYVQNLEVQGVAQYVLKKL